MSGLFGGSAAHATLMNPMIAGIRMQTSVYGTPIPIVYGKNRISGNLLWYGDFLATAHTSGGGGGGKGGASIPGSTSYTYTASVIIGICEGPASVPNVWQSTAHNTPAALGISIYGGAYPQSPWSYLTSAHPSQALGYPGVCYAAAAGYALDSNGLLPNHTFEVSGAMQYGSGIVDANPKDILTDFLTNVHYGVNPAMLPPVLGNWTQYSNYCVANGIFLSPALTQATAAQQFVQELMDQTNSAIFESEGLLKIIPYGDQSVTGNGVTFTPNVTPVYDLTDDDFLYEKGKDPVRVKRGSPSDAFNQTQIKFVDRSAYYNPAVATAQDQSNIDAYGLRPMQPLDYKHIMSLSVAQMVAQIKLQRSLYIRNQYEFTVGWKYCLLEPMDIVTLTDPALGMNKYPVRIVEISEDENGKLQILAEDFPAGIATAALYPAQASSGYNVNFNVDPGAVNTPLIFDAPGVLTATGYEVWCAVSGGANYGGCDVWVSFDNLNYKLAGTIHGGARYGVLSAAVPAGVDPDTADTFSVDLTASAGTLTSGSSGDADNLNTLCMVDQEFISYSTATLTAASKYNLTTYIRRGQMNSSISAHAVGASFARLDDAIFKFAYDSVYVGKTVYVKFLPFNQYGGGKYTLAAVSPFTHVIGGSSGFPSNVTGFAVSQNSNVAVFQWNLLNDSNIAGYEIRYNPAGQTLWANGTALTQVTKGTQITTAKVPPGSWTFMIKARDTSGNYSQLAAFFTMSMSNTQTIVNQQPQSPDWLGAVSGFVRHPSGVLIPESTKSANQLTNAQLFTQFVPYPVANCTYTAPEVDLGFDTQNVRLHGEIISILGPGISSGAANPQLQLEYRLGAGAYSGFSPWSIGNVMCRYFRMQITLSTASGNSVVKSFSPTADEQSFTQVLSNQVIVAGGTNISFPQQCHAAPSISVTNIGTSGLIAAVNSITTTGCTVHLLNTGNVDVGGTATITVTGV